MPSVNFSEKEWRAVCGAAASAFRIQRKDDAVLLNELASKMNKSLSLARMPRHSGLAQGKADFRAPGPIDAQLGIAAEG